MDSPLSWCKSILQSTGKLIIWYTTILFLTFVSPLCCRPTKLPVTKLHLSTSWQYPRTSATTELLIELYAHFSFFMLDYNIKKKEWAYNSNLNLSFKFGDKCHYVWTIKLATVAVRNKNIKRSKKTRWTDIKNWKPGSILPCLLRWSSPTNCF